ncbi:hypothetical protein NQ317_016180 [Molorchus minor]|uniref:Uncharacterized protein n=1 Tax=Molorchus minor TaxID=1323400 RepID=A0ABQ9JC03_9CUCU|nr:hypothetical protein NQ317_016180 [Molorchus minor]
MRGSSDGTAGGERKRANYTDSWIKPPRHPTRSPAGTHAANGQPQPGCAGHRTGREGSSDHDPILLTVWDTQTNNSKHTRKITDWGAHRAHIQTHIHDITLIHNTEELNRAVRNLETDINTTARNQYTRLVREELNSLRQERWNISHSELYPAESGYWKTQKVLRTPKRPIPPIHTAQGPAYTKQDKAEAFADSLEMQCRDNSVADGLEEWEREVERRIDGLNREPDEEVVRPLDPDELKNIIRRLKARKASWFDGVSNRAPQETPQKRSSSSLKHRQRDTSSQALP